MCENMQTIFSTTNFLVKKVRQPGVEPGSIAWKATMLTATPPTLDIIEQVIKKFYLFGVIRSRPAVVSFKVANPFDITEKLTTSRDFDHLDVGKLPQMMSRGQGRNCARMRKNS